MSALLCTSLLGVELSIGKATAQTPRPYVVFVNGYRNCCASGMRDLQDRLIGRMNAEIRYVPYSSFDNNGRSNNTSNDSRFLQDGADFINNQLEKNRPLILIGHSFGGDSVLKILPRINRRVQFVGVIDPVRTGGFRASLKALTVPINVDYFFNRWQNNEPFPNDYPVNGSISCNAKKCDQDSQFAHTDTNGNPKTEKCRLLEACRRKQVRTGHQTLPTDDYIQKIIGDKIQQQLSAFQPSSPQTSPSSDSFSEWQEYPGGGLGQSIAVSQDGTPFIIGTNQRIYKGSGSGFVELSGDGRGTKIAVDAGGKVWIVGTNNRIFFHNGSVWAEYPGGGLGQSIAVSQDGTPFIIGTDQRIYKGSGSGWVELSGDAKATNIAIDGGGKVWIVGTNNRIFFHNGSVWAEYPGGGLGQSIAVSRDGTPFIIGTNQRIYKYAGSGWVELSSGKGKSTAIDGGGKVWIIGINDAIYSYPK